MRKMNFIKTSDSDTADILKKEGFTLVEQDSAGVFTFLNNSTITFAELPKNIIYTNVMCM